MITKQKQETINLQNMGGPSYNFYNSNLPNDLPDSTRMDDVNSGSHALSSDMNLAGVIPEGHMKRMGTGTSDL